MLIPLQKARSAPAKLVLNADRKIIKADGVDLSFITVKILDANGNFVPYANNEIQFSVSDNGTIAGVDNGSETSLESFKANHHKAYNGLCLLVVQPKEKKGTIQITATSKSLQSTQLDVTVE